MNVESMQEMLEHSHLVHGEEAIWEIALQLARLNELLTRIVGTDQWGNVGLFTQSAEARLNKGGQEGG